MKKLLQITAILFLFATAGFAADNVCKDKEEEAKKLASKCKAMGKGTADYEQCKSSYNLLKQQVKTACEGGLSDADLKKNIAQWQELADRCKGRQDERCANALSALGTFTYKYEDMQNLSAMTAYEEEIAWCADRDNQPAKCKNIGEPPKPNHDKSLEHFMEFIKKYSKNPKMPNVLYQSAAVLESSREDEKAFKLRMKLVQDWPNDGLVPKAWLRIAEYHFMNRKFRDAIEAYKKVTGFDNLMGKEAALAMYHLAESYYNIADYEVAAQKYYEYISGADQKKYPADLRQEAMDFMAASFSDMEDGGVAEAAAFLKDKKVAFKDSLYFRIGMKNKDHDRNDQAIACFKYLLDINPDYVDAPLADIAMVQILITQQKPEDAQRQRLKVVERYSNNSSWFRKNQQYPKSVESAKGAIRAAMLDIPTYHYVKAKSLTQTGDIEGGKREFNNAIKAYNDFLKRYASEPSWDEYKVHGLLAVVYQENKIFDGAVKEFNWISDCDTTRYGRRPMGYEQLLKKEEAGFNAVLAADAGRDLAVKNKAGGDDKKGYTLSETKAYFTAVDKYMAKYGKTKDAPSLAYNAAVVHYNAQQYTTAIAVLKQLRQDFPKHENALIIARMLAQSQLEANYLDDAQKEFEWLLVQYSKVKETRNDSMAKEMDKSIAAVLYQKADKANKDGKYETAAKAFMALVDRYPMLDFSDKAVFEAAAAYENAKMFTAAAETFMLMPRKYAKSPLTIKAILRAATSYKKDNKAKDAARTFLFITDNFPQDSMAFSAISWAAGVYDSSAIKSKTASDTATYKKMAAQTYEIAYKRYPKHEKTPSLLYSACLSYEEAKVAEEAIRCSRDLVRDYPKSTYALDAAYSIPMAYVAVKKWDVAAEEFMNFARMYQTDKEKLIAAYMGAARAFMELKNTAKAGEQYKNVLSSYDKYGLQIKNADPSIPAEAAFMLAEFEFEKLVPLAMKGNDKEKNKRLKEMMTVLGTTMSSYAKSAEYASEKWTFKATNKMGMLFVTIAAKIRDQEMTAKNEEGKFAERIGIVQQLPSYYEQARPIFEKNLILAREQGFYNEDVVAAEEGYVEMFYQDCAVFFEVADAFKTAPVPDRKEIIKEYMDPDGDAMVKADAEAAADEDLVAYKEELNAKGQAAAAGGVPKCATGIKASSHYQIDNKWTQKLYELVRSADTANEALAIKIQKFDPTTLFKDPAYFKTKARVEQIASSKVMTPEEQLGTYRDIVKEGKALNAKLKQELQELQSRLRSMSAPAPTTTAPTTTR